MDFLFKNNGNNFELSLKMLDGNNMRSSHSHDTFELYVLLSGERNLFVKDKFFEISKGYMFLIKPYTEHRTLNSEKTEYTCLVCNINPEWLKSFCSNMDFNTALNSDLIMIMPQKTDRDAVLNEIENMKKAIKLQEQGFEFSVAGSLMKLLSVFFRYKNIASEKRINKSGYERISNIIKYINNNYSDNIQLSALAERFYISEFYMCRLFKEYTGKSVISYITIARITKAKNLLVNTNTRINLIYKQCGFGSLSNFNRCFKELCGKTPMQYRKTNK